jgi:hypothetical protein
LAVPATARGTAIASAIASLQTCIFMEAPVRLRSDYSPGNGRTGCLQKNFDQPELRYVSNCRAVLAHSDLAAARSQVGISRGRVS